MAVHILFIASIDVYTPLNQCTKVLKRRLDFLGSLMGRTETLQRIKDAEKKVLAIRKDAEAEREKILKDARRAELELQDKLRGDAEEQFNKILEEARRQVAKERETILGKGRAEATTIKELGKENSMKAVAWLVEKFKGAVNA